MKRLYFTTGEFAGLCNTTKETLRHYHRIGLLIPVKTKMNGYYYYSDAQVNTFYLIDILKSSGCSLETIGEYLSLQSREGFEELLKNQLTALLQEKQKLLQKERQLRQSIEKFELLKHEKQFNDCQIVTINQAEYYIGTPIESETNSPAAFLKAQKEHIRYCRTHGFGEEYQLSYLTLHESLVTRNYYANSFILSRIAKPIPNERLFVKPQGRYIRMIKHWNPDTDLTFDDILNFAQNNGYEICGNAYESEIAFYMQTDETNYITEILVEIR